MSAHNDNEDIEEMPYDKIESNDEEKTIPFWSENPNVLLQPRFLLEFFPTEDMCYEQKLNAISRLIILLTIVAFIFSRSIRLVIIAIITLFSIHLLYFYKSNEDAKMENHKQHLAEPFDGPARDLLKQNNIPLSPDTFMTPSAENPFSNVLLNDYDYNPTKSPAPYSAKPDINAKILDEAKQLVQNLNPDQPDIANKLFKDLGEQYVFEQSLRPFYSTARTTIPNDQAGFANFCYGSMVSCKEGNPFACARNLSRHTNV